MTNNVSVQTIVIVGCVCGLLVVLLCIALAIVCCRRRRLMKKNEEKTNSVSTQSASPVSSQSTVDDVSKPAAATTGGGVMDPGFDNPSIDLSSLVQNSTPHSVADSRGKHALNHNNGRAAAAGWHDNGPLPLSVHWSENDVNHHRYGGNDVSRKHELRRIPSGDSGYTGASAAPRPAHHLSATAQSPSRGVDNARDSFRTDAHGRPVKKVIHEVIV